MIARVLMLGAALVLLTTGTASATGFGDGGNAYVTIQTPAYVTGDLWASSAGVFATITREHSCWYPQDWWDDTVVIYEDGIVVEYDESSPYYDNVRLAIARAITDGRDPEGLFAEIDPFTDRSCIQATFIGRDDCSTDELIGVLSTAAVHDAFRGARIEVGSFDAHDEGGLYCLVVIERDPWLEIVHDEALIPEPVHGPTSSGQVRSKSHAPSPSMSTRIPVSQTLSVRL